MDDKFSQVPNNIFKFYMLILNEMWSLGMDK